MEHGMPGVLQTENVDMRLYPRMDREQAEGKCGMRSFII
jgi:hypothetical protein